MGAPLGFGCEGAAERPAFRDECGGQPVPPRARVAARAGAHSVLSTLLDPDARARRTEPTLWLRFGASNRGEGASVRVARSARPNARDNRARHPQLWARGYTLRDAL